MAPAWAQQAAPAPAAPPEATAGDAVHAEAATLPTVTVTARKSAERAKDLPFSVQAVSGEEIEARRMVVLEDLLRATPGVDVNSWGGMSDANVRIRGVGSLYQVSSDDSSVVINVDGVPMSMRNANLGTLDVERVEVLKGPQGTLFGRNSEAGAINVITRRPTRTLEGYARGEIGQHGQHVIEGAVGGPISERLSGRLALRHTGEHYPMDNLHTGGPLSKPTDLAWRGSLLWDVQPGTNVLLTSERERVKGKIAAMIPRPYADPPVQDITPGVYDDNFKTVSRHSIEVNHDLPGARLTSVTAYVDTNLKYVGGSDRIVSQLWQGVPTEILRTELWSEKNVSQDLRLSSLPGAPLFWVAGLNYFHGERQRNTEFPFMQARDQLDFSTDSKALYGEVTYPLNEQLKATLNKSSL